MYLPIAFAVTDLTVLHDFMEQYSFATLVTQHSGEMIASHIPSCSTVTPGPRALCAAISPPETRNSRILHPAREALVMFQGPHSYISPSWYAAPENVPTWNYTAVHASGVPKMVDRAPSCSC